MIAYDALKLVSVEQDNRIENFKKTIAKYEKVVKTKDSIIDIRKEIIKAQDKIINAKKPLEFHTYVGIESFNLTALILYGKASLEFKKINVGAKVNYSPTPIYELPNMYYNIIVEYKIF